MENSSSITLKNKQKKLEEKQTKSISLKEYIITLRNV